jgi:hypothetical protein
MTDNTQIGPPGCADTLVDVVGRITYKPGWKILLADIVRVHEHLAGGSGLTLIIENDSVPDSTDPSKQVGLTHFFVVPPASYDAETWERWVLDCIIQVESHEAMEFFKVDGWAPYFPPHGPANGRSPYTIERRQRA